MARVLAPLTQADVPRLQAFFEANPEYYVNIAGQPPLPTTAQEEFDDLPPPEFSYRQRWMLEWADDDTMTAMVGVLAELFAPKVWHIGLMIVATALHGTGRSQVMYRQLEDWMREGGAHWIRLGVVAGNTRAERFWQRMGYTEVRRREGVAIGLNTHVVRLMVKPLYAGAMEDYLALVTRDRPGAP